MSDKIWRKKFYTLQYGMFPKVEGSNYLRKLAGTTTDEMKSLYLRENLALKME